MSPFASLGVADEAFALVGEGDDAGRQPLAFLIGDDLDLSPLHDRDNGIGGAEVDADDFCHRDAFNLNLCQIWGFGRRFQASWRP